MVNDVSSLFFSSSSFILPQISIESLNASTTDIPFIVPISLCSIIFQSTFYHSLPFLPPEECDASHPFKHKPAFLAKSRQDPELGLPPTLTDELGASDKERETTTAGTTPRGLSHSLHQTSESSLNRLLASSHPPSNFQSKSIAHLGCFQRYHESIVHGIVIDLLSDTNYIGDLSTTHPLSTANSSSTGHSLTQQKTFSSISSSHHPTTSVAEKDLQPVPPVRPPPTSQASSTIPTSSRLIGAQPLCLPSIQTSLGNLSQLFPSVEVGAERYHRTPDPTHDPWQSISGTPNLSEYTCVRRPLIKTRPTFGSHVPRDLAIAHSQKLRRVDTVEEVTEAPTSIREIEGVASVRSSIITPIEMVRDPSVNEEYVQAMLRLASQSDSETAAPISTAPNPSVTPTGTPFIS